MTDARVNVLVLGGSPEALLIAERLAARDDVHVITSIGGRDEGGNAPAEGDVRIGGFADAQALAAFVRERRIRLLIDAADPFTPRVRRQAAEAALHTGVTRLVVEPAAPEEQDDDVWVRVSDCAEAAELLPGFASRVMLDLTPSDTEAFASLQSTWFLLRGAEKPDAGAVLASCERVPTRVGASVEQEQTILRQHDVDLVVTRESVTEASLRLLQAARAQALPVMLLQRPTLPPSDVVSEVDEVLAWVDARFAEEALPASSTA